MIPKGGMFGKILRVNLTEKTFEVEEMSPEIVKNFIGGSLLGAKILYDDLKPGIDPLGEENELIYTTGPLTGTDVPCASRLCICTKSPLTGTVTASLSGGYFPAELKWTGYDAVVISGKAEKPTYIYIRDDKVTFHDATKYWGLHTLDTQLYLKEDLHDQNIRVSCIGPAGENLSLISGIFNEARAAGRKGIGAVAGSKNLKAVVIRGKKDIPIADKDAFSAGIREMMQCFKESPMAYPVFSKVGSSCAVEVTNALGVLPYKNWLNDEDIDWDEHLGPNPVAEYNITRNPCYKCPIACSQVRLVKSGKYAGIASEGPEYESLFSLGTLLNIKSPEFTIAADRLCDELGIDSISAGATTAFAMELYEKGIFTDTDGMELKFGKEKESLAFIRMLAHREGFAEIFADGTKRAAEKIGKGSEKYTLEVKGLELPAYDVRGLKAHGLNFATCYTGADHNKGYAFQEVFGIPIPHAVERLAIEGKGKLTKFNQDFAALFDIVTYCEFPAEIAVTHVFQRLMGDLISAATGLTYTEEDMWKMGERLNNITRLFNIREGFGRKDDTLPERIKTEPLKFGLSKGEVISQEDLDYMLDEYYKARGWDEDGVPSEEKLKELELI
ncbi:MAG: aldehyde ferredoxin oxidoreductase family protein [Gudongella sp.]|jgi:aldehyde:ferredoxin oxidoreductase|nr:aldehyde ferredoxin oxidoreductase family protein [Gudongella sp.]